MAITKLGNYELPLTSEERGTLISYLAGSMRVRLNNNVRKRSVFKIQDICMEGTAAFRQGNGESVVEDIRKKFQQLAEDLKQQFPAVNTLGDPQFWLIQPDLDAANGPSLNVNRALYAFIGGEDSLEIDLSKITDAQWVEEFEQRKSALPTMVKTSPEIELYTAFNDKLNDVVINAEYHDDPHDYTKVIEEIVQAVKEGKL